MAQFDTIIKVTAHLGSKLNELRATGESAARGRALGCDKLPRHRQRSNSPTRHGVVGVVWSPPSRCVRQTDCPLHSACQSCVVATTRLAVTAALRHYLWGPLRAPTQTSTTRFPV